MPRRFFYSISIALTLVTTSFSATKVVKSVPDGETFTKDKTKLIITSMDQDADIDYVKNSQSRYKVDIFGYLKFQQKKDVVAYRKRLKVKSVVSDNKVTLYTPKRSSSKRYKLGTHSWSIEALAAGPIEAKKIYIKANPYTIDTMELETTLIMAKKRQTTTIPAAVMDKELSVGHGLSIRITVLSAKTKGLYKVEGQYKRRIAGPTGSFFDSVYCLDRSGKVLGGGRFTGDPLGENGKLECYFFIKDISLIRSLKLITVIESKVETVSFKLNKIFKK